MFNFLGIQNELNYSDTPPIKAIFCSMQGKQINTLGLIELMSLRNVAIPIINSVSYRVSTSQISNEKLLVFPEVYEVKATTETSFDAIILINTSNTFSIMRLQTFTQNIVSPTKSIRVKFPSIRLIFK